MDEKSELIAIKVSPILKRRLETIAKNEGTTVSGFIRKILINVLDDVIDFTLLSTTKLQRINYWSMFSQRSLSLDNKMLNLIMVIDLAERLGRKKDAERYNKMSKDVGKEIIWIDEALNLISKGRWNEFHSYIEKGYNG